MVEADIQGFFDHRDHDGGLEMLRVRITDRALLGRIRKWLKAGVLETEGWGIHPDPGTPQGGVRAPVLAHGYWHDALDLWCETVVQRRCRGEAVISRDADDLGGALRFRRDAAWCSQALPKRRGQCNLEVAPEKTRLLRGSRLHRGMTRRFTFWGCACFWKADRQGVPRVKRRPARTKLPRACPRIKAWMQANRHLPGQACFNGLHARLLGHYRYDGGHGHSDARSRCLAWAMPWACKGLNRRGGKRRSVSWARVTQMLDAVPIERPRLTEVSRRRVFA